MLLYLNTYCQNACVKQFSFLSCFLINRHLSIKTTPTQKFVFTVKTHSSVVPGTIAFSLPQVHFCIIIKQAFLTSHDTQYSLNMSLCNYLFAVCLVNCISMQMYKMYCCCQYAYFLMPCIVFVASPSSVNMTEERLLRYYSNFLTVVLFLT